MIQKKDIHGHVAIAIERLVKRGRISVTSVDVGLEVDMAWGAQQREQAKMFCHHPFCEAAPGEWCRVENVWGMHLGRQTPADARRKMNELQAIFKAFAP